MKIINKESLSLTLDNINSILFVGKKISALEKKEIALWIADRQGQEGSYGNMFAPAKKDYESTILFTGDKIVSNASTRHILGEEALRTLYLLNVRNKKIESAIKNSRAWIKGIAKKAFDSGHDAEGTFCCGKCTAAYWRNLSAEGVNKNKKTLTAGIEYLKSLRDGKGKWKRFPFFYTLLTLNDIDLPAAKEELRYTAEVCKRYVKQKDIGDIYKYRRKEIARRSLALAE